MEGNEAPGQGPLACHLLTCDHGCPVPRQAVIGEVTKITEKPGFGGPSPCLPSENGKRFKVPPVCPYCL